jgi:hypothetical protein
MQSNSKNVNIESVDESKPHIEMDLQIGVLDIKLPGAEPMVSAASVEQNTKKFLENRGISIGGTKKCIEVIDENVLSNPFEPVASSPAAATSSILIHPASSSQTPQYDFEPIDMPSAAHQHGKSSVLDALNDKPRSRPLIMPVGTDESCQMEIESSESSESSDDDTDGNEDGVDFAALPVEVRTQLLKSLASKYAPPERNCDADMS